jgi:hypothetical protein
LPKEAAWSLLRLLLPHPALYPTWPSGLSIRLTRKCKAAEPEVPVAENQPPLIKHTDSTPSTPPSQSPIERTADLLENHPTEDSATSSLPTKEDRPRPVLRNVILFIAENGSAA